MTQPTPTGTGHVLALALVIVKRRSTRSELNLGMSVIGTTRICRVVCDPVATG
jgi:hypothetical protein